MKKVARNLFRRDGWYYFRWKVKGQSRRISLHTKDEEEARAHAREIRKKIALAAFEGEPDTVGLQTITDVLKFYAEAGCPKRNGVKRIGQQLKDEQTRLENIARHLGPRHPAKLTASDWLEYIEARRPEFKRGTGDRALDLEWITLQNAFRHCAKNPRKTGLTEMPRFPKPDRQRRSEDVVHCRDFQPANAEELHKIAERFLMSHQSEVFGWFVLLSAMIGQRRSETLRLRMDAKSEANPGYDDGSNLWLYRSKTHKGTAATCEIGPELRACLNAHRTWHNRRSAKSPWFFPSPLKPEKHFEISSFTHALQRACKALELPRRTAHGLRSYFVNVLRSRGVTDAEIALRIGHKSGGKLIVDTYGEKLPIKLDWIPEGDPAWARFNLDRKKIVEANFG